MPTFSYIAQRYSQGKSKANLLTFTAEASDILRWGGVPSKNERFHGGFQRALSARYRKIISYFDSGQISPGAIVVAFRPGAATVSNLGYPNTWPPADQCSTKPEFVHLALSAEVYDDLDLAELISRVRTLLEKRPGFNVPDSSVDDEADDTAEDDQTVQVDADAVVGEPEDEEEDDLDVGHSKLKQFYNFIGDDAALKTWLTEEGERIKATKAKKALTQREKEYVAYSPTEKLKGTLLSLLRPAMIVDGQHRVNGASESDNESVAFAVCAIQESDWVEQVFQFVVLNKMARPISKDFLTELLNTSLTNQEVDEIDKRLEIIGIKNSDRRIHKFVNHDPRSPFLDLVAEAGEVAGANTAGKLSQQGMLTLAKRWRSIGSKKNELSCFFKYLDVSTLGEARETWRDYENWIVLFFAFWSTLRTQYEPQHVWVKQEKYHLLYIVTLQALQDLFIESKAGGQVKFTSLTDFQEQVKEFFSSVPGGFFLNWNQTGLQSGSGWDDIKNAVKLFQNGSTLPKVQKESVLFKEQ